MKTPVTECYSDKITVPGLEHKITETKLQWQNFAVAKGQLRIREHNASGRMLQWQSHSYSYKIPIRKLQWQNFEVTVADLEW